jgi:hypothetical protein
MRTAAWLILLTLPAAAFAQSAGEVERCFQNPAGCSASGHAAPAPSPQPTAGAAPRQAAAPDYVSVLKGTDSERRKLQESLRTLDRYNGPIDGDLLSEATTKAVTEWQKAHSYTQVGKLTPTEAITLNNEAARAPIRRLSPSAVTAAPAPPSNADLLKALRAKQAERRKAAEPKAEAATQGLLADLKAFVAADGKGIAGDQFVQFAEWYAGNKATGRTIGDITPSVEDYGDAKAGQAATVEVTFQTKQGDTVYPQCLMFTWIEGTPRKSAETFACDNVAALEKWKSEQSLKSAWR